jgi:hypothetical protein
VRVISGARLFPLSLAIASDARHIWVADGADVHTIAGDAVTELSATSGRAVRVVAGSSYDLGGPGVASNGPDVFVDAFVQPVNAKQAVPWGITEINARTGGLVRVISGSKYGFDAPSVIVTHGTDIWVLNTEGAHGGSVTEIKASSGALVRVISGSRYRFDCPDAMVTNGTDLFVANAGGNSVTEIRASTGALLRRMTAAKYGFDGPSALLLAGSELFVANTLGTSVTEVNAKTGAFVGLIMGLHGVGAMASNGTGVFVAGNDEITEIDASNGQVVRTFSGPSYGFADPSTIASDGANLWVWNLSMGTLTELPTAAS